MLKLILVIGSLLLAAESEQLLPPSSKQEKALLAQVNKESRRLYNSLDVEGKRLAIELFRTFQDKNMAVQAAAMHMAQKRIGQRK